MKREVNLYRMSSEERAEYFKKEKAEFKRNRAIEFIGIAREGYLAELSREEIRRKWWAEAKYKDTDDYDFDSPPMSLPAWSNFNP